MKHILIITLAILAIMSFISSPSWSETVDDLVEREGTVYKKFSDVPFTGRVEGKAKGSFKNGKQEGSWIGYHDNGQLSFKVDYINGKQEGSWVSYYKNGQLSRKGKFKDGKQEGYWVSFWENGMTSTTGDYKNGKEEGSWASFWDNGQVWYEGNYKNGKKLGYWVGYLNDGSIVTPLTGTFKDGVKISD